MHVLLSKSDPYPKEPTKVIIDKQQMIDLLSDLNKAVYDIMDEYEMTKRSRDRAEREFQKHGDEIVFDASRKAEDIYAASVMYTDEALNSIQDIIKDADEKMKQIYNEMEDKLKDQEHAIKKNQLELKSNLQDLRDTEKYLKLIEDRNREIQKEKEVKSPTSKREANIYANRQSEVKVNMEVLAKLGLSPEEEEEEEESTDTSSKDTSSKQDKTKHVSQSNRADSTFGSEASHEDGKKRDAEENAKQSTSSKVKLTADSGEKKPRTEEELQEMEDLDQEYFQWKDEQEEGSKKEETPKENGFLKTLKGLAGGMNKTSNNSNDSDK